jgi:HD-GYP domain-containing protein (c-di-GMP phosphodiesterase class II)
MISRVSPVDAGMPTIPIDQLKPGVFISLDGLSWMEHPFLLNSFRITSAEQIATLRGLGLTTVQWDPVKSTAQPLAKDVVHEAEPDFGAGALSALMDSKRDRIQRVRDQREALARCARLFEKETDSIRQVFGTLGSRPDEAHTAARTLVGRLVSGLINASSVAVHLVNLKTPESGMPNHAMNVMVVSLLIGKSIGASEVEMNDLGLGAMLHDIGKTDVPSRVLRNPNRNASEEQFYRGHTGFGIKNVAGIRDIAVSVKNVIACHHERWDGKGFPNALVQSKIPKLARIVAIANRYDNLCNPLDPKTAKTPAEAVATMFKDAGSFDPDILGTFVKALGVYPPGTFVTLTDGSFGLVVETNNRDLLRPLVMIYDAGVPRNEALLIDMREADAKIETAVTPQQLPLTVVEYLAPQGRVELYLSAVP